MSICEQGDPHCLVNGNVGRCEKCCFHDDEVKNIINYDNFDLRDLFASKAMQAELTYSGLEGNNVKLVAAMSYEMADAMMKARNAKTPQ